LNPKLSPDVRHHNNPRVSLANLQGWEAPRGSTFNAVEMNGESFRLKHSKRHISDDQPPTEPG
jgi:hypothetical protein